MAAGVAYELGEAHDGWGVGVVGVGFCLVEGGIVGVLCGFGSVSVGCCMLLSLWSGSQGAILTFWDSVGIVSFDVSLFVVGCLVCEPLVLERRVGDVKIFGERSVCIWRGEMLLKDVKINVCRLDELRLRVQLRDAFRCS